MNVPKTQLPRPNKTRWQPLRAGLVDIFYYDYQEFWFRDGRLLLRGNNGTGKSKVLALTLPFLLDGRATPSRVEPDGDVADAFRNLEAERQELEGVQVAHHTAKEEESQILTQIDETKPGLQQGSEMRDANPSLSRKLIKYPLWRPRTCHVTCYTPQTQYTKLP